jgi:hypothetical protein
MGLTPRMGQRLLATRSLLSLDGSAVAMSYGGTGTDFLLCRRWQSKRCYPFPIAGSTLRSDALHPMRGFFTRERDDFFSPASRGTEMLASP